MIAYNHEAYIREAIDGVLMQETNFDLELIISNDGSSDRTHSVIEDHIRDHPRRSIIKYFHHEKNIGMMPNFIFTLKQCTGKYVALCEGDDHWTDSRKLQKQVDILEKDPEYSMVISNREVLTDSGSTPEYYEKNYKKEVFTIEDVVNGFVPGMQTIVCRNYPSFAEYLEAHPGIYYADRYLAYYCTLFGNIFLLKDITAVYRLTGSGVWSVNMPLQKLHKYVKFMEDFHASLGIPSNNSLLARLAMDASYTTLRYCVKRPRLFANKEYRQMITKPWNTYRKLNRVKLFISVMFNRE